MDCYRFLPNCKGKNLDFKILLILNNAPGHLNSLNEMNSKVNVIFLLPKTTLLQVRDQWIIPTFKVYYLRLLFKQFKQQLEITQYILKNLGTTEKIHLFECESYISVTKHNFVVSNGSRIQNLDLFLDILWPGVVASKLMSSITLLAESPKPKWFSHSNQIFCKIAQHSSLKHFPNIDGFFQFFS